MMSCNNQFIGKPEDSPNGKLYYIIIKSFLIHVIGGGGSFDSNFEDICNQICAEKFTDDFFTGVNIKTYECSCELFLTFVYVVTWWVHSLVETLLTPTKLPSVYNVATCTSVSCSPTNISVKRILTSTRE